MKKLQILLVLLCISSLLYAQKNDFTGYKIFINPGHGGHDSDDRHMVETDFWESEGNLAKGLYLQTLLKKLNATTYISRTTNTTADDLALSAISAMANTANADIFLSIHITLTSQNISGVRALMDRLHEAGVEALSLSVSDPDLHEELSRLRDHAADINLRLVSDLPVPYSSAHPVALETAYDAEPGGAGKAWMYVEPDGDVLSAQGMADKIHGNILRDAWEKIYPV